MKSLTKKDKLESKLAFIISFFMELWTLALFVFNYVVPLITSSFVNGDISVIQNSVGFKIPFCFILFVKKFREVLNP